ncbi:MAG: hypothetical protein IT210_09510 [Armatimonadetes bacterium]|nr:hypothetical protein [Armatimonadota bacterium]
MRSRNGKGIWVAAATVLVGSQAAAYLGKALYINGAAASGDVRVIQGKAYAPLSDIAKALGMKLQTRPNGYELVRAGGAEQIANKNVGKMGTEIFTGKWRFTVMKVEKAETYTPTLATGKQEVQAGPNEELVVVTCRIKNGTPNKEELVFERWQNNHTALTDASEQSFEPALYDVRAEEQFPVGATFLPGSAINFTLVFKVPAETEPKDLIFSAIRYKDRGEVSLGTLKPTDIRVQLSE